MALVEVTGLTFCWARRHQNPSVLSCNIAWFLIPVSSEKGGTGREGSMGQSYSKCHGEEKLLNPIRLTFPPPRLLKSLSWASKAPRALWIHSKSPFSALALLWPLMTSYCALIGNQGTRNDQAASLSPYSDDNGQSGQLAVLT